MIARIQCVDYRQQLVLTLEWVQVHYQGLRRFVQPARPVEVLPPQRPHMLPYMGGPKAAARSAAALYTNATNQPIICNGPRWKRGRFRSGLSLS